MFIILLSEASALPIRSVFAVPPAITFLTAGIPFSYAPLTAGTPNLEYPPSKPPVNKLVASGSAP